MSATVQAVMTDGILNHVRQFALVSTQEGSAIAYSVFFTYRIPFLPTV